MNPARGLCFVRPVKTAETLVGGVIVLTENVREQWTMQQAEVVAVGKPVVCKDEDCERPHVGPQGYNAHDSMIREGDWVLVSPRNFVAVDDATDLWALPQDQVLAVIEP